MRWRWFSLLRQRAVAGRNHIGEVEGLGEEIVGPACDGKAGG